MQKKKKQWLQVAYVGHSPVLLLRVLAELNTAEILQLLGVNEFMLTTALPTLIPKYTWPILPLNLT